MNSIIKLPLLLAVFWASIAMANAAAPANTVPNWNAYAGVKITITGQITGVFPVIYAHGFSYAVVSPRDAASGLPTGKRQHNPIKFTKLINNVSPLLFQAIVHNENLNSVVIQFLGTDRSVGTTITLTNANISRFAPYSQSIIAGKPLADGVAPWFNELEDIEMTFQKIEISSPNGATAQDDWEQPVN